MTKEALAAAPAFSIAAALASAACYGAADFFGGLASRRTATYAVVVWSQAAGLLVLAVALPLVPGRIRLDDLAWGVLCGVGGAFAIALLYRALALGTMGVVSPLTAVLAAALPVVWGFARGERPAPAALAGIGAALAAVVLVSLAPPSSDEDAPLARAAPSRRWPPGIPEALGAGTAFGLFFIALAQTHPDAALVPLVAVRLTSLAILAAGAALLRRPLRVSRIALRTIVLAGVLDMAANVAYVLAAHAGALSIVAVLSSLYPAVTVALAALVLGERLVPLQWAGVGAALAGVTLIALAR